MATVSHEISASIPAVVALPANFPIIQDTPSDDEIGSQAKAELRELLRVREDTRFQL